MAQTAAVLLRTVAVMRRGIGVWAARSFSAAVVLARSVVQGDAMVERDVNLWMCWGIGCNCHYDLHQASLHVRRVDERRGGSGTTRGICLPGRQAGIVSQHNPGHMARLVDHALTDHGSR